MVLKELFLYSLMLISLKPLPAYPDAYYPVTDNSDADSDRD